MLSTTSQLRPWSANSRTRSPTSSRLHAVPAATSESAVTPPSRPGTCRSEDNETGSSSPTQRPVCCTPPLPIWLMMAAMTRATVTVPSSRTDLARFYREHLERVILPFWLERTLDEQRGGIFSCIDDASGHRVADDKFVWSQARWAWTAAHAA